ncbi:unnamed protein product [Ceutorhynchus assimilis]|uniref:Cyclin N-terminal domain-containing protein n=1 Tax=Ceutorhynchus assimilis TaxID=467358 RepID=A0A9N9QJS3_9CUCU|nr:unnamed protein product [Ceutorhynchus assimilis]
MSVMDKDFENHLVGEWFEEMQKTLPYFVESALDPIIINTMKQACDIFRQTDQVFFSSVDVAEQYLILKEQRGELVEDPLLLVITTIFIASKFFGGGPTLGIEAVRTLLRKITHVNYNPKAIKEAERDVLQVLQFKIPVTTILDDFNVFFEEIIRKYNLQDACKHLCVLLLMHLYGTKPKWLKQLKGIYKKEMRPLRYLLCTKSYLPAAVMISAFKLTHYKNMIDINAMLEDIQTFTKIHPDHIHALSDIIVEEHSNTK